MKEIEGDDCFRVLDNKGYILFYFGASWCAPCQKILPLMDELIKSYDETMIQFYKIDIDKKENELLCNKCQIKVVPSFLLFKERRFINRMKGGNFEGVKSMINNELFKDDLKTDTIVVSGDGGKEDKKSETEDTKEKAFAYNRQLFNKKNLMK